MNDVEQAFRDALRRADTARVPVPPLDPAQLKAGGRRPRPWQAMLAAAAAVMLIAGVGIAVWPGLGGGVPAVPVAPATTPPAEAPPVSTLTTVEVDLHSGQQNPVVELDPSIADELYAMVADHEAAGELAAEASPLPGLGFRGFVVTSASPDRPPLRVLPGSVRVGPDDDVKVLRDAETLFFDPLASALTPELRDLVASASVQLRVRNVGKQRFDSVELQLPSHQRIAVGMLGAGRVSGYQVVGEAYRYARILTTGDGQDHKLLPADYVGETPLAPGRYTYEISAADDGGLNLNLVEDAPGGWPEEPEVPPADPADGPDAGATASWELLQPEKVGKDSTEITIGVTRLACASGVTGEVLEPVISYEDHRIVIRTDVAPLDDGGVQTCQGNDVVPVTIALAEPIGDRDLVDAACLAGDAVTTGVCVGSAVRWTP